MHSGYLYMEVQIRFDWAWTRIKPAAWADWIWGGPEAKLRGCFFCFVFFSEKENEGARRCANRQSVSIFQKINCLFFSRLELCIRMHNLIIKLIHHSRFARQTFVCWIPAFAGMTWVGAGMTWVGAWMTGVGAGMTEVDVGMTVAWYGNNRG